MGNSIPTIDWKGWADTVGEYLIYFRENLEKISAWPLEQLKNFALNFAQTFDIKHDGTFVDTERLLARELGICASTPYIEAFIALCSEVLKAIVVKALNHPAAMAVCKEAIKSCLDQFIPNTVLNQFCNDAFIAMLMKAYEALASTGSALKEVVSCAAGSATGKVISSAVVIDVSLLGVSGTYHYYLYKKGYISWEEFQRRMAKRTVATGGSIAGTTTGALVGTAFFPGIGTFVGGFIGGMVGNFVGLAAYDNYRAPAKETRKM